MDEKFIKTFDLFFFQRFIETDSSWTVNYPLKTNSDNGEVRKEALTMIGKNLATKFSIYLKKSFLISSTGGMSKDYEARGLVLFVL